jgi:hypothetical protein
MGTHNSEQRDVFWTNTYREETSSFEAAVPIYQFLGCHIPEDWHFIQHEANI